MLTENKALRAQQKIQKMQQDQVDLSSDEDSSNETDASTVSQRIDTQELADMI